MSQGERYDRIAAPVPGAHGPELQSVHMLAGERITYRVDDRMDVFAGSWHNPSGRNTLHADQFFELADNRFVAHLVVPLAAIAVV